MFVILMGGRLYLDYRIEPLILCSAVIAGFMAWYLRCQWQQLEEAILNKINVAMQGMLIIFSVGCMVGAWMFCGTVPFMVYWGLELVNPNYMLLSAFLICTLTSCCTGTSWGSAATIGVAMIGIAHGIQPLSSFHLGAGERHICHKFLKYGVRFVAVLAVFFFAGCQLFAGPIVGLFLAHDSAMFASSVSALRMYSVAFLLLGFNVVVSGFFTAMEHPIPSLTISFGRGLVLISGCLVVLAFLFGANGIWLSPLASELVTMVFTICFLVYYFRRLRREEEEKEKSPVRTAAEPQSLS